MKRKKESVYIRFMRKWTPEPFSGCWLWTASARNGYGSMAGENGTTNRIASRISWELHRGPIPDGLDVLHQCDTPLCVNPDHLFLGTTTDNMEDAKRKGRTHRHPHYRAILSRSDVSNIKRLLGSERQRDLARRFNVSRQIISDIATGRTWRHA